MDVQEALAYINAMPGLAFHQRARRKGWLCPLCGNGGGSDGDGVTENPHSPGHYKCFRCGASGSVLDWLAMERGITPTGGNFPAVLADLFSKSPAEAFGTYVAGSAYAPALAGMDISSGQPDIRVSLDKRALKGNKVQVLERDTTVVVPTGPFPVMNGVITKNHSASVLSF